jgi:multicomponent Na+:H+ antiporter subunit D
MAAELLLLATIVLPISGAVLIAVIGERNANLRETVTILTSILLFISVCSIYNGFDNSNQPALELAEPIIGLSLEFRVEPLGLMFALVCSFLWIATSIYSIGYMRGHHEQQQTRFYVYFALAIASTMGVAFSANMFSLFVFYEFLTLITYPLVTHSSTEEAKRAGRLYLGYLLGTSFCLLLLAIVWTWLITGTLEFTAGGVFDDEIPDVMVITIFALYIFGIGKAALMPFHRWLPAAMVAPTPVSALLHAVAVVKAGVFTVLKITIYLFGLERLTESNAGEWIMYVAGATILIASLIALSKDDLKARLAYSTVSQLSYVILGALLANTAGVIGAGMHIAMHAFGKITLFFCAGAIMVASHKTEISDMRGLGRTMPFTMAAFLIGSLSVIGLPPMGGMWSKWFLVLGTLEGTHYLLLAILLISSLLNVAYLLPIPIRGFFDSKSEIKPVIREAPLPCLIAIGLTSLGCVLLFLFPQPLYELMQGTIQD